jgi:hypothetical protein
MDRIGDHFEVALKQSASVGIGDHHGCHIRAKACFQGVYINASYSATATVNKMMGKKQSSAATFSVYSPGQAQPSKSLVAKDKGVPFSLTPDRLRSAKRYHGDTIPDFCIVGHLERELNDIDVPLGGWIMVKRCATRITSIELQLIRAEYCATAENAAREATEIQNIQISDGEVMKGLQIPIYMFFPRWYTCAALRTRNLMVNYIPTTIDEMQLRQLFEMYGPLESVKIVCDRETRSSKGYGFVKYRFGFSAVHAIQYLNGYPLMNKRLKVAFANQAEASKMAPGGGAPQQGAPQGADFQQQQQQQNYMQQLAQMQQQQMMQQQQQQQAPQAAPEQVAPAPEAAPQQ